MYRIQTVDLYKRFPPNIVALDNLNIEVDTFPLAILGPNGSGKTTFLSILCGLRYPTSGSLYINDIEPYRERNKAYNIVSFMYERPDFPLRIKIKDLITMIKSLRKKGEDRIWSVIRDLGINEFVGQMLGELSSGQSQLVGLLVATYSWDGIVVLDEPFSHLDILRRSIVVNLLSKIKYLVFTTHVPEEAEAIARYIMILNEGKIIWAGDVSQMYKENVFEVYLSNPKVLPSVFKDSLLYKFGKIILVRSDEDELSRLYRSRLIIGFRRSGVKHEYIKALDRGKMVR